jgi:hypothetical protein
MADPVHHRERAQWRLAAPLVLIALWAGSYVAFRSSHVEVWQRDGRSYLIIPSHARWLYYIYRPLMYVDGALTGMRFHIGPHSEATGAISPTVPSLYLVSADA